MAGLGESRQGKPPVAPLGSAGGSARPAPPGGVKLAPPRSRQSFPGRPPGRQGDRGRWTGGPNMPDAPEGSQDDGPAIAWRYGRRKATPAKKASGRKATPAPARRAVKLLLAPDVHEALVLHAMRRGLTLSGQVEALIRAGCAEWTVHAKPGPRAGSEPSAPAAADAA
jgi:hypothetical protein